MFTPQNILEAGAILVVFAGIIGGLWGGYKSRKSTDNADANQTIELKEKAIEALREEVAILTKRVNEQDEKIKHITEINNAYIRLFSGDPSRLEEYMAATAKAITSINDKIHAAPAVIV